MQDEVAVVEEQEKKVLAVPTFSKAVTPQQQVPGARIKNNNYENDSVQ